MALAPTYAAPQRIEDASLDSYTAHGIALSRDAGSIVYAALRRDAYEMRQRGGDANLAAAQQQEDLAQSIVKALCAPTY